MTIQTKYDLGQTFLIDEGEKIIEIDRILIDIYGDVKYLRYQILIYKNTDAVEDVSSVLKCDKVLSDFNIIYEKELDSLISGIPITPNTPVNDA